MNSSLPVWESGIKPSFVAWRRPCFQNRTETTELPKMPSIFQALLAHIF